MFGTETYGTRSYGDAQDDGTKLQSISPASSFDPSVSESVGLDEGIATSLSGAVSTTTKLSLTELLQYGGIFAVSVIGKMSLTVGISVSKVFSVLVSSFKKVIYALSKSSRIKSKITIINKTRRL